MPDINFISNGEKALELYGLSMAFSGDESQKKRRSAVREKIVLCWPELQNVGADQAEEKERIFCLQKGIRQFNLNAKEQTALAEGFLGFVKDKSTRDIDSDKCFSLAKLCKCSKWLNNQVDKCEIRDFEDSDEQVEVDEITED